MCTANQLIAFPVLIASVLTLGCMGSAGSPSAEGKALLLSTEPTDAMGIVEFRSALVTGTAHDAEAAVMGRVGGGQNETWDPDQAVFFVRDRNLKIEAHDHDGSHDNCKYCQADKEQELAAMALIRMVDAQGNVIPQDARQLLGLKPNHIIVAQGQGLMEDGMLVFDATKIYIQP